MGAAWSEVRDDYVRRRRPDLDEATAGRVASVLLGRFGGDLFWHDARTGELLARISDDQFADAVQQ